MKHIDRKGVDSRRARVPGSGLFGCLLVCLAVLLGTSPAGAQKGPPKPSKPLPTPGLALAALAGQAIPVLPTTFVVVTLPTMHPAGLPADHAKRLAWADSVIMDGLVSRGPAVTWLSPDTLRRAFKHSGGMLVEVPTGWARMWMAGDKYKRGLRSTAGESRGATSRGSPTVGS